MNCEKLRKIWLFTNLIGLFLIAGCSPTKAQIGASVWEKMTPEDRARGTNFNPSRSIISQKVFDQIKQQSFLGWPATDRVEASGCNYSLLEPKQIIGAGHCSPAQNTEFIIWNEDTGGRKIKVITVWTAPDRDIVVISSDQQISGREPLPFKKHSNNEVIANFSNKFVALCWATSLTHKADNGNRFLFYSELDYYGDGWHTFSTGINRPKTWKSNAFFSVKVPPNQIPLPGGCSGLKNYLVKPDRSVTAVGILHSMSTGINEHEFAKLISP